MTKTIDKKKRTLKWKKAKIRRTVAVFSLVAVELSFSFHLSNCILYDITHPNPPIVFESFDKKDICVEEEIDENWKEMYNTSKNLSSVFSETDVVIFAGLLEAEGGCVPKITRERIGITFLNRINSSLFMYNTVSELVYQEGQYETAMNNLIPTKPKEENLELAVSIMDAFVSGNWEEFCLERNLSTKVVFQANSTVDQTEYSFITLEEYGSVGENYNYHMIYGESIYDYTEKPYEIVYVL